jgi:Domain of unknown function (DUF4157)/CHAP domain
MSKEKQKRAGRLLYQVQVKAPPAIKPVSLTTQRGLLQRKCACGGTPGVDGECEECRSKRLSMQRRAITPSAPASPPTVPPIVHEVLGSPGQPLDAGTRVFMEPRFGHDFSNVKVHTDAKAAESARVLNALAYTVSKDVVFGAGQYTPGTTAGQRLVAHELAHVVQQDGHSIQRADKVSEVGDVYEQEADRVANEAVAVENGSLSSKISPASPTIARQAQGGPMSLPEQPGQTLGPTTPSKRGQAAAAIALGELGVNENPPHSNSGACPPGATRGCVDAYTHGRAEPWCANFVSWCFEQTGFSPFGHLRAVSALRSWAKSQDSYVTIDQVRQGNFVPMDGDIFTKGRYEGRGPERHLVGGHTGFVLSYNSRHKTIHTVEGNSGDTVASHTRSINDLDGFIRIGM